jgi:hypothetical protein
MELLLRDAGFGRWASWRRQLVQSCEPQLADREGLGGHRVTTQNFLTQFQNGFDKVDAL